MKYFFAIPLGTVALLGLVACSSPEATSEGMDPTTEESTSAEQLETDAQVEPLPSAESPDMDAEAIAPDADAQSDLELAKMIQANLDAQLPDNQLTVAAEQGNVTVTGEAATAEEIEQAEAIVLLTEGVQSVEMQVDMAMPAS